MLRVRRFVAPALLLTACAISTQQEVEIGQSYAEQINARLPLVRDPEVTRYINLLGDSIARVADDRSLDWHFYVVDSKEVNAFAVPGGFVYVNRGLIERMTTMSQLATVLGHEIGHVTLRHSVKQMQSMQRANLGITIGCILTRVCANEAANAAIQVGGSAVFARFSRNDEAEADVVGIDYAVRARIDPRGMPEMFRILIDERSRRPDAVSGWFSTHPLEEERITAANAEIAKLSASALKGLTRDTPRFQEFRRRLTALPPAAAGR